MIKESDYQVHSKMRDQGHPLSGASVEITSAKVYFANLIFLTKKNQNHVVLAK